MKTVCDVLAVSRSNMGKQPEQRPSRPRGRPPLPDEELVGQILKIIADLPTYGYRRVHAILRREAIECKRPWPNAKRVYRVMKVHGLLFRPEKEKGSPRRHEGRVAVTCSDLRWCSDGFEIACDNREKVRVAFALDCCDRQIMAHVATTEGLKSTDIQDLAITAVEARFGRVEKLPHTIEWLSDNGSCFIAKNTKSLLRQIGMEPRTTPVRSPQSNGMAEAFVKTFRRDYLRVNPLPDAGTVIKALPEWFRHYNRIHPHSALKYRSPNEFRSAQIQTGQ